MTHARPLHRRILRFGVLLSLLGGIAVGHRARFVAPFRPRVNHMMVQLPRAHRHLDGLTIAFVSDTHVGPHFTGDDLAPITRLLRRTTPDLVLFGGDYISESPRFLKYVQEPLRDMAAIGKSGAFGILGNHDMSNIGPRVVDTLRDAGITMLQNQAVEVDTRLGPLWIVGIDDALLGKPDLARAFSRVPADAPTIAMWHEPDLAPRLEPFGPFLMLTGHTHGGQVRLPLIGPLSLPMMGKKYISGRYELGDMTMLVSNGIGMYRPPVRLNCPPEVLLIRLIA